MNRCLELLKGWDRDMAKFYAAQDAPRFIHSLWRHEVSYRSQVVPDVSVTIEILIPHYTDRYKEES
jgi:hypothetical protein